MWNRSKYLVGVLLCCILVILPANVYAEEQLASEASDSNTEQVSNDESLSTGEEVQETVESNVGTMTTEQQEEENIPAQRSLELRAISTAEVATFEEFKDALNDPSVSKIVFTDNINLASTLRIPRSITIDGNGYRLSVGEEELKANFNGRRDLKLQNMLIDTGSQDYFKAIITSEVEGYTMALDNVSYLGLRTLLKNINGEVTLSGTNDLIKDTFVQVNNIYVSLIEAKDIRFKASSIMKGTKITVKNSFILEKNAKVTLTSELWHSMAVLDITEPNSKIIIESGAELDITLETYGIKGGKESIEVKHGGSLRVRRPENTGGFLGSAIEVFKLLVRPGGEIIVKNRSRTECYNVQGINVFDYGEARFEKGSRFDITMYMAPFGSAPPKENHVHRGGISTIFIEETDMQVWDALNTYQEFPTKNYMGLITTFKVETQLDKYSVFTRIISSNDPDRINFFNEFQMNKMGRISNTSFVDRPPLEQEPDPGQEPQLFAQDKTIKVGQVFNAREDVWAKDATGKDISSEIKVKNMVNTNIPGIYSVTYKVLTNGKLLTKTITVTVIN